MLHAVTTLQILTATHCLKVFALRNTTGFCFKANKIHHLHQMGQTDQIHHLHQREAFQVSDPTVVKSKPARNVNGKMSSRMTTSTLVLTDPLTASLRSSDPNSVKDSRAWGDLVVATSLWFRTL